MSDEITVTRIVNDDGSVDYVTSDGEILDLGEGGPGALAHAVAQFSEAREQERAWGARRARWQALIIAEQSERRAVYDDRVVTLRANPRTEFNREAFVEAFTDQFGPEMDDIEWGAVVALLGCVTGLDADALVAADLPDWADLAKRQPTGEYTRTWVDVAPVLKDGRRI